MDIKRVSFIEVRSPESYIFRRFPIPRVGSVLLSTILSKMGCEVKVFIEDISQPDWNFVESSDVVCISTITSTVSTAYKTVLRLKKLGIPVIMGGAHPSFVPDECLGFADFVVRGEGDIALPALINYMRTGTPDISTIAGVSYKTPDGTIKHNPTGEFIQDLDALPDVDFSLIYKWKHSNIHPVATMRGCAYNCRFCLVSPMFGRKYRFRSVKSVTDELKRIASVSSSPLFFVDDNFAANRTRTKQIIRFMLDEKITPRWSAMMRPNVVKDEELLTLMAQAGKFTACLGFESITPESLIAYEKKQTHQDNIASVKALKEHGIKVHGMFVFGADTDTIESIKRTVDFAANSGIDSVQFMILTPLPGTAVYEDLKTAGRILHTQWDKYDIHHTVFRPAQMTPSELHMETLYAMKRFYSWKYVFKRIMSLDLFYGAFGLYSKSIIRHAVKESEKYVKDFKLE
ncbi:MAG: radical SAM protein [Nitrospirae bacterium]|nr:radical SAM protein [Nitrospirota bacterium]MBF0534246.1 radical SAM protein [Nitrospirota bacterium]MBF0615840.1 radical SAM protein [Nitrospirota bacterium]